MRFERMEPAGASAVLRALAHAPGISNPGLCRTKSFQNSARAHRGLKTAVMNMSITAVCRSFFSSAGMRVGLPATAERSGDRTREH
jgi:hypothetical protein